MELKKDRIVSMNRKNVLIKAETEYDIWSAFDSQNPYVEKIKEGTFVVDIEELSALSFYGKIPDVYRVISRNAPKGFVKIEKVMDEEQAVAIAKVIDDIILSGSDE